MPSPRLAVRAPARSALHPAGAHASSFTSSRTSSRTAPRLSLAAPAASLAAWAALLLGCATLLAGCATTMPQVADFGDASTKLATDYRPFVTGLAATCEQRAAYRALSDPGAYDMAAARRDAAATCAPLRRESATAALFADALADYAAALNHLAGQKDTAFDGELRGLSGALARLPGRDGSALFPSDTVSAATKVARAAAALALRARTQSLTRRELADNQADLAQVVQAMKTYATTVYAGELAATRDTMRGEYVRLVASSAAAAQGDVQARLPFRWAQQQALADLAANEAAQRHVAAFAKAADALVAAHAALVDRFDTLGGQDRLAAVTDLVAQVQALRDGAAAL